MARPSCTGSSSATTTPTRRSWSAHRIAGSWRSTRRTTTARCGCGSAAGPRDISAFEPEVHLDPWLRGTAYDYPNPIQLLDEVHAPIHLIYRDVAVAGEYDLVSSRSTDGGESWEPPVIVAHSGLRSYWKSVKNGEDRIDFAYTDVHPAHGAGSAVPLLLPGWGLLPI